VAEHTSILENNQNTYYRRFSFTPKTDFAFPKQQKLNCVMGNAIPVLGVKPKREWYVFWLFFKVGLCSAISFKRSRRELSIYVAEHKSIVEKY